MTDLLLTDREVVSVLGCSRSTLWRWTQEGSFPKPMKFGGMSRWKSSDIDNFIASASAERDAA